MATNYWSQQLGFVDDVPSSSAARRSLPLQEQSLNVGANSNSHQQGSSLAPHELDSLESWIVEFENRTAEKKSETKPMHLHSSSVMAIKSNDGTYSCKEQAAKEKADEDAIRERESKSSSSGWRGNESTQRNYASLPQQKVSPKKNENSGSEMSRSFSLWRSKWQSNKRN